MNLKNLVPEFHFNIEKWKYYMPMDVYVSSFGRFKDKDGNILPPTAKNNYIVFRGEPVHRLVMMIFKPVPGCAGMTVDHLDHNTRNNRIDNLEWVSVEENQARARKDAEVNEKTMLERTQELLATYNEQSKATITGCVKLNGEIVPTIVAKHILCGAKDLKTCHAKIESAFAKIVAGTEKATEIVFGNNKIEIIKE